MRLSAVNFIRKSWSKSFNYGIVYKRVGFKCISATISRKYTELFYKLLTRATESGWLMGSCNFRNILPINVPKCYGGKIYVFWQETFKVVRILLPGTWSLPFHYGYCWSPEHSHSRKTQSQRKLYKLKCLEKRKSLRFTLQMKHPVLHSLVRIWDTYSELMLVMNLE